MASKDLFSNIRPFVALDIATISTDTTTEGNIIDTQGYEGVVVGLITGTVTDGDYAIQLTDGDDSALSDEAVVTDANLLGTEALASFTADTDDDKISKLGYIGIKRYIRVEIVSTNTSSGAVIGAWGILGNARSAPDRTQTR
jgi:hypothetical protein